LSLFFRILS